MRLHGSEPTVAGIRLNVVDGAIRWRDAGGAVDVGAGGGIASAIADLVLGRQEPVEHPDPRERGIPVDQTHTSVIVDERWVVKIVRSWGASDRSSAILNRLKGHHSLVSPELAGTLQWEHPELGTTTLALVTEYIPDSSDGWTWAIDDTLAYLRNPGETDAAPAPDWPEKLGELTANMHAALLLAPQEPHAPDPRSGDRAQARAAFDGVFQLLDPAGAVERHRALHDEGFVERLRARKLSLAAAIDSIPDSSSAPLIVPHGDYHVGQLLRTSDGRYLVLDFDGDPQWDADRRLRPDGAVRDVAHMLVSIDLVAAATQRRLGHADERAWDWARRAQAAFLDAYRKVPGHQLLDTAPLRGLIAEQLLHELLYAERYLPRWRYAPDGVISRRYPAHGVDPVADDPSDELYFRTTPSTPNSPEPQWNPPASPMT